jgi:hypothetical protein
MNGKARGYARLLAKVWTTVEVYEGNIWLHNRNVQSTKKMSSFRLQNCNYKSNLKLEVGGKQATTGDCRFYHYVPRYFLEPQLQTKTPANE